jgi:hypothetical protein
MSTKLEDTDKNDTCKGFNKPKITLIDCAPGYKWIAVNLNEIEECVRYIAERKGKLYPEPAEVWANKLRSAIGYTLDDLTP